jgi:PucR family transcriptional regulator, purine catabolism regulatory protein
VTLSKDVNFVDVTQVVHALILGNQAAALHRTQQIHEAFTALTLRGTGPEDVVRAAAEMSGRTVVLENLTRQAVICEPAGGSVERAVDAWEQRSRAAPRCDEPSVQAPRAGSRPPRSTRANGGAAWSCSRRGEPSGPRTSPSWSERR